jgi:hypothetical protein
MRLKLDVEILDVRHALRNSAGDRGAVDKILHLDEHVVDEQRMHRGKI